MFRSALLIALLSPLFIFSQNGIIPFTGIVYDAHGVTAEEIDATLNGENWTSNRLPLNAEMKIRAIKPVGFATEEGLVFPGVQVLILTMTNDTLANLENIMGEQSFNGIDSAYLSKLSVTLTFEPGNSKPGDSLRIVSRFFDTKGPAYLWTKLDLVIVDENLPLEVTNNTNSVTTQGQFKVIASGVEIEEVTSSLSSSTGLKMDSDRLRIGKITGLTKTEFEAGTTEFYFYNNSLEVKHISKSAPDKNKVPKSSTFELVAEESVEGNLSLTSTIYLSDDVKFLRMRWTSKDRSKVIDFVSVTDF